MRKTSSFGDLAQQLIDVWISQEHAKDPASLYSPIRPQLAVNMILAVVEKAGDPVSGFEVRFVDRYKVPTSLADLQFPLGEEFDFDLHPLSSPIANTFSTRRPTLFSDRAMIGNLNFDIDLVVVPKRKAAKSSDWCVVFMAIKSILRRPEAWKDLDDVDLSILQLLREGFLTREIGERLRKSPRTVEHRLERLKALLGARTLHDLAVRSL
ncbi:AsnC family protein [Rhizobium pisi]|uniref:helix-turn-helix transcriptional regulator n=1 Tax=Rhizobium pisi TaxID=574561 RepID=UPI0039AEF87F